MPKFFFNSFDGEAHEDVVGTDFANTDAAELAAVRLAGEFLVDNCCEVHADCGCHVEMKDEWGLTLFTVHVDAKRVVPARG